MLDWCCFKCCCLRIISVFLVIFLVSCLLSMQFLFCGSFLLPFLNYKDRCFVKFTLSLNFSFFQVLVMFHFQNFYLFWSYLLIISNHYDETYRDIIFLDLMKYFIIVYMNSDLFWLLDLMPLADCIDLFNYCQICFIYLEMPFDFHFKNFCYLHSTFLPKFSALINLFFIFSALDFLSMNLENFNALVKNLAHSSYFIN